MIVAHDLGGGTLTNRSDFVQRQDDVTTALVILLLGSTFLDEVRYSVSGLFNVRASFLVAAVVLPIVAWRWRIWRQPLHRMPLLPGLLALNIAFYISTLINWHSPTFAHGLVTCTLFVLNISLFVLVYRYASNRTNSMLLLRVAATLGAAYAVAGALALISYQIGFPGAHYLVEFRTLGNWTMGGAAQDTPIARPWFLEPIIGSYLAAIGVMAVGMCLTTTGRRRWSYGVAACLIFVGVTLTYSRGAWIAAVGGLVTLGIFVLLVRPLRKRAVALLGLVTGVLVGIAALAALVGSLGVVLSARLANIVNPNQGTGAQRIQFWVAIIRDGLHKPILGHGANAYQLLLPPPTCPPPCGPYVAENATVEIFHTSGIVGLAVYIAVLTGTLILFWRSYRRVQPRDQERLVSVVGLASIVTLVVSAQVNPSFWGNMYWALFGLAVAFVRPLDLARDAAHQAADRGSGAHA